MKQKATFMSAMVAGLTLSLVLNGCGGNGAATSGFPDPVIVQSLPAGPGIDGGTVLRTFQAGDSWEYEVTGNMIREVYDDQAKLQSRLQGPVTGRMVRQLTAAPAQGAGVFKLTESISYAINNGSIMVEVNESFIRQEADGSVSMLGRRDQSTNMLGTQPYAVLPRDWAPAASAGGQTRLNAVLPYTGTLFDISTALNVTQAENVTSTSTPFRAWRTVYADTFLRDWNVVSRLNAGEQTVQGFVMRSWEDVQSIDWWLPSLGAPVKREYKSSRSDNVVESITQGQNGPEIKYFTLDRTLDLKMVLKNRTLR